MTKKTLIKNLLFVVLAISMLLTSCGGEATKSPTVALPTMTAAPPKMINQATMPPASTPTPPPPTATATSQPTVTPSPTATAQPTPVIILNLPDTPDYEAYRAVMRTGHKDDVTILNDLPHYDLALDVNNHFDVVHGKERYFFSNQTGAVLQELVFRLYPNYPNMFGEATHLLDVGDVEVNGQGAEVQFETKDTVMVVPMTPPLATGDEVAVTMNFTFTLQPVQDGLGYNINSFYPMLAIFHPGQGWDKKIGCGPDPVVSENASYAVNFTTPKDVLIASTGVEIDKWDNPDGRVTHQTLAGPVRDFTMSMGQTYQRIGEIVDGVAIHVTFDPADEEAAQKTLSFATNALPIYDAHFGDYPFAELDVMLFPNGGGGEEYPGFVYVYYGRRPDDFYSEQSTVHEIAHQWWYNVVGNDNQLQPWLDESFANYSVAVYFEKAYNQAAEEHFLNTEHDHFDNWATKKTKKLPIGRSACGYADLSTYVNIIYKKGMFFLEALRQEVGDDVFFAILQTYYTRSQYRVVTGRDFLAVAEDVSGMNLNPLYEQWVGK